MEKFMTTLILRVLGTLALLLLVLPSCQVMEFKQESTSLGEIELSNSGYQVGEKFATSNTSVYIFDLGPVYEASIEETIREDPAIAERTKKVGVIIRSEFHWLDVLARLAQAALLQPFYIPGIVGTRTMEMEGMETK